MINKQIPLKRDMSDTLSIHSMFYTIQGEGPFTGSPALFVRLAGCNLRCPGCDTEYTKGARAKHWTDLLHSLLYEIDVYNKPIIVITGGEPFRQDITALANELQKVTQVQIETNGTMPVSQYLNPNVVIVCSPKTTKLHPTIVERVKHYKYVLDVHDYSSGDGLPMQALGHRATPCVARPPENFDGVVYLQPMDTQDTLRNEQNLAKVVELCLRFGHRLQLQIHKIINVE